MACLMIQGTGSDVGKSVLVAGLCLHADVDAALDELAVTLATHFDLAAIRRIAGLAA